MTNFHWSLVRTTQMLHCWVLLSIKLVKISHSISFVSWARLHMYKCFHNLLWRQKQKQQHTVFENHQKCRIWVFQFWLFPPIFVLLNVTCLVILFDRKVLLFKNSPKLTILGFFNELLSNQNVNVARFARNFKWDFFCDFQTPCKCWHVEGYMKLT